MFIVLSPLNPFSQHPAFDKILRSSLIICLIWGVYNLCDAGQGLAIQLLKRSNREYGQTLILITHDESIALQADRILTIEDGRIVKDARIRG